MRATPARLAALRVLRHVRAGGLVDSALHSAIARLAARDRAWTTELVRGTLRLRGRLDHMLAYFTRGSIDRLDPDVLDVLRLGAYQLLEMDGVPAFAAVSQSVEMAKPTGGAGLVNAVLRALLRADDTVPFPAFETDPTGWLTTWGSHPGWLIERWIERFGTEATRRLVESNNERPPLYLRPIRDTVEVALDRLAAAGIGACDVEGFPSVVRLEDGADVSAALAAVAAVVQDPAAGRVADFVGPPGGVVVDLCAAPGGKAVVLAAGNGTTRASVPDRVVGADVSEARIRRVVENAKRLGLPIQAVVADGRMPPFRAVDTVIVDAPCTGTGTLRRHADARWRIGPDDVEALVKLQAELLDAASMIVRPCGLLVYATCSVEFEENDGQVNAFMAGHGDFDVEVAPAGSPRHGAGVSEDGRLRLLPHVHGFDGAFAVRLRRRR